MDVLIGIGLSKKYMNGDVEIAALQDVNICIHEGEFLAIIGPSGSGKTTLMNVLCGLEEPSSGKVFCNDHSIWDMDPDSRNVFRRENIGVIFQQYNLLTALNVYDNIVFPLKLSKKQIDEEFVDQIINSLDLKDQLLQYPDTLSGGQQQRVAIARAMCSRPNIIFADEPTGNLDSRMSKEVIVLMKELAKKHHQTVAVITHDDDIAKGADRILKIMDGVILDV